MKGINKAILVGIVGQEPDVKKVSDTFTVASFSLATTESFKDKESGEWKDITEWHNISCYNGLAGVAERNVTKGSAIYVEGKIKTRSYDKDGVKMYRTEVFADTISVIKKKEDSGSSGSASNSEAEDDDLPF